MRTFNVVVMFFMLLFAILQYNDADGAMWAMIYLVPAVWAGIGAFRNSWLADRFVNSLLLASMFAAAVGMLYFWPKVEGWWQQDIWWEVESVREGMGMMLVLLALFVVWFSRPRKTASGNREG